LFVGSAVGALVASSILLYGKTAGWFPPGSYFTWRHVLTAPAAAFAMLCGYLWLAVKWEIWRAKQRDAADRLLNAQQPAQS